MNSSLLSVTGKKLVTEQQSKQIILWVSNLSQIYSPLCLRHFWSWTAVTQRMFQVFLARPEQIYLLLIELQFRNSSAAALTVCWRPALHLDRFYERVRFVFVSRENTVFITWWWIIVSSSCSECCWLKVSMKSNTLTLLISRVRSF